MRLTRRRSAFLLSTTILASLAFGFEPAVRRDLSVGDDAHRLTVGAVRMPLWSAALAQGAGPVALENVTVKFGTTTYTAKRVEVSGSARREDLQAAFDSTSPEPLASRLARINASQITIPEVVSETDQGAVKTRSVIRNVVLRDIVQGKIRQGEAEGGSGEMTGPEGQATLSQGKIFVQELDLTGMARVYAEKPEAQAGPMTPIYKLVRVENLSFQDNKGVVLRLASAQARDVAMRSIPGSWNDAEAAFMSVKPNEKPTDEETVRLLSTMAEMFDGVQIGLAEATGLQVTSKKDGEDHSFGMQRIAYTGATGTQPSDFRMEGLDFKGPEGFFKVGTVSYTGFSFAPTVQGWRSVKGKPLDQLDSVTIRSLIPTIGTLRYSGLAFDFTDKKAESGKPERVQASLENAELTADKPLNGIPTNIRMAVRNFAMPLPAETSDEALKSVLALGYKAFNLSYTLAANWNEAASEIALNEISVDGSQMGRVALKGTLGGVAKDVFNPDTAIATVALLGATAKSADLTIENGGLFERFLDVEARKQKKTAEALRREYGAAAAFAIPMMLGNSDQAKTLGQAVARFIARPTRLRITAKTRNPAGLGLADVAGESNPAALFEKLEITATTDERL